MADDVKIDGVINVSLLTRANILRLEMAFPDAESCERAAEELSAQMDEGMIKIRLCEKEASRHDH